MGELLIKPYEISVWDDKLINGAFTENKIAVIGSNTMTGLNKVYDPVFSKKTNGERTLSFSLRYKYFDPYTGNSDYVNPFAALLVNERKVKLHYDNQWYEFVIKDHVESSDGLEWTYTCSDAFVLELSKNGYNLTFDSELNNNQGTARELAQKVLQDTDWQLGGVDNFKQFVAEPIYEATLASTEGITIINASGNGEGIPPANTDIYVFYNYVKNQEGQFVQFIIRNENRNYIIDDNNVITDTNFRISNKLTYDADNFCFKKGNNIIIQLVVENNTPQIENRFQANRLVYKQLTTYDPIMQRTVDRFKASSGDLEVYKYSDYTYTTSNVITNLITNGDNFNVLEDGTLQGWNPYVDFTGREGGATITPLKLITKPELGTDKILADLSTLSQIEGFLRVNFKGALTLDDNTGYYKNAIFNSGIENNASTIQSISVGDEFVFRWRAGTGDIDSLLSTSNLRLLVAKYIQDAPGWGYYYKYFTEDDIILQTTGTPQELNNYITGGTLQTIDGHQAYVIDNVPQTPSTKYIYKSNNVDYIWDASTGQFTTDTSSYLPYYYLKAKATKAVTNAILTNPKENIGIFIYNTSGEGTYYIQDIQLTRFIADADGKPLLLGNIPVATSTSTDYYYVKPSQGVTAEDIVTYATTTELINDLGLENITIKPLYNTDSEKNLTISASKSNCFNILQTIAETFECWVDLVVDHEPNGAISIINGLPQKFVYLREYVGKDNYAGFKYGINLKSIERTINSDEIVTKLIVDQSQSDYVDEGFVSIANATSNTSGESYILNFDYYYNQGLLNRTTVEADKNEFNTKIAKLNRTLQAKEKQREDLSLSLTALTSKRNVYTELVETAEDNFSRNLAEFEHLTGRTYQDYQQLQQSAIVYADKFYVLTQDTTVQENKKYYAYANEIMTEVENPTGNPTEQQWYETLVDLSQEETVLKILGELYVNSSTINNYSGLLTNIEKEYWEVRKKLRGIENYSVKIWVGQDDNRKDHIYVELNDYLSGFSFNAYGNSYQVTVSQKYFDILINSGSADGQVITFTAPTGYTISPSTYTVNKNKTQTIRIVANGSSTGVEDDIDDLHEQKDNLTREFNNKYRRFIQEGTWSSTDYIDSELYYLDALQVSNTSAQPTVSYTINVVEISELEDYKWYNFDAGDKTYVEDTEFFGWASVNGNLTPAREEVIVSEVEWHLDEPENNIITVQNYKTRFEDLFQRISAAVQTVQYNEATYAKISTLLDANGTINQDVLLESLNKISGQEYNLTSDGSIMIHGDEILIQNLTNRANCVILNSEGLRISSDGGKTWRTAIDGQGINIGTVYTGTLNTQNVIIGSSENPSFRWDKSGISAYKENLDTGIYDLQTYVRYDQYGLYGIKNGGAFKAQNLQDVLNKAHFAVTWDGFFIKNSYTGGGRVEITSDNDFRVLKTLNNVEQEVIKIGALEWNGSTIPVSGVAPTLYGIRIKNDDGTDVFTTGNDGNIEITGTIHATGGDFNSRVNVGPTDQNHIIIDGTSGPNSPSISSSTYSDSAGTGWIINKDGDAVFNNITARGAIKTAVFEYAEIQAVGGVFIFRPSSTIKSARISGNDLILTVEKPALFDKTLAQDYSWCKISNYTSDGSEPNAQGILTSNGLTHVYKLSNVNIATNEVTLTNGAQFINAVMQQEQTIEDVLNGLNGGALVDMGREDGSSNYGIGVNSSDNIVNLPRRAISLFETNIYPNNNIKVAYNIRGILGTLPILEYTGLNPKVHELYHQNLEGTQGIYTDNMYIGDNEQYIAFYTHWENHNKYLKINTKELTLKAGEYNKDNDDTNQNFVYLSNEDYGSYIKINNNNKSNWRLLIGKKFGVDKAGNLYASNANIEGHIQATSGTFGSISYNGSTTTVPEAAVEGLTNKLEIISTEASHKGYTLYVQSSNETQNSITLTAHVYYGNKEITSNMDAGLFLWYQKNEDSNTSVLLQSHVKSIVFDKTTAGYGTTVICSLALDDEVLLITPDYYALETPDGYLLTAHV